MTKRPEFNQILDMAVKKGWIPENQLEWVKEEYPKYKFMTTLEEFLVSYKILSQRQVHILLHELENIPTKKYDSQKEDTSISSDLLALDHEFPTPKPTLESNEKENFPSPSHPVKIGRYKILSMIGQGGMGEIYLAYDPHLDRKVAIKILKIKNLPRHHYKAQRFLQEAKTSAKLRHPNIVSVYDLGCEKDQNFLVMDYIEGMTLKKYLISRHLSLKERIQLILPICDALSYAHKMKIIHRDIKPSNIMVDQEGKVFLMDFGLGKEVTSSAGITQAGVTIGTPMYMAPEQAKGYLHEVDHRSDLYSLGAVIYEMVTDHKPFQGKTPTAIIYRVIKEEPIPPRKWNPEIPEVLEKIIQKAMAKEKRDRYQDALEMKQDLEDWLKGKRTSSIWHSPVHGTSQNQKRKLLVILIGIQMVLLFLFGGAYLLWGTKKKGKRNNLETHSNHPNRTKGGKDKGLPSSQQKVWDISFCHWPRRGYNNRSTYFMPRPRTVHPEKWSFAFEFNKRISIKGSQILVGEILPDSKGLEIIVETKKGLQILDSQGNILGLIQSSYSSPYRLAFLWDFEKNGIWEIVAYVTPHKKSRKGNRLLVLNGKGKILLNHEVDCWDFQPYLAYRDNKQKEHILNLLLAGYELQPRGLLSFDYTQQKETFFYATGGVLGEVSDIADWNGDGLLEFFLNSSTVCNGSIGRGIQNQNTPTTDFKVHFVIINEKGKEIWTQNTICENDDDCGSVSGRFVKNNQGKWKLVLLHNHSNPYLGTSKILVMELPSQKTLATYYGPQNKGMAMFLWPKQKDKRIRFLVIKEKTWMILDLNLNSLLKALLPNIYFQAFVDINRDGAPEILGKKEKQILVISEGLKILWQSPFLQDKIFQVLPSDLERKGRLELLVLTEK
ncbi:MAG: serine/threonine protein kinase, partial [Planctomycetota bacterium]